MKYFIAFRFAAFAIVSWTIFNSLLFVEGAILLKRGQWSQWTRDFFTFYCLGWLADKNFWNALDFPSPRGVAEFVFILGYEAFALAITLSLWRWRQNPFTAWVLALAGVFASPLISLLFYQGDLWLKCLNLMTLGYALLWALDFLRKKLLPGLPMNWLLFWQISCKY